ncbi:uncharacterized protein LOC116195151 [Punica granatum]|uniref:Uncharacterized protein LOC116195151 n=2 Tax=Punica granatum TaxID=22663 RepID=A0A218XF23_PUNGR|nr:uncharacterized protein LOC116195151 [Punica granatum]OWM83081.1 hypothetical protein CDL15_Pgr011763 [Punica granatum]
MDHYTPISEGEGSRKVLELAGSVSNRKFWRPSARHLSAFKAARNILVRMWQTAAAELGKAKYIHIKDAEDSQLGIYDRPLPCFGCGIGWFSFLLGFICPLMWYYATILYFGNYYRKDPRERAGLAASAIAAMTCSVVLVVVLVFLLLTRSLHRVS